MSVETSPNPPALCASSLSRTRERAGVRAISLRKIAKGAGTIVLVLIAIDLVATVITIAVGAEFLKR